MTTHSEHNFETNVEASLPQSKSIQDPHKSPRGIIKQANELIKEYTQILVGAFAVFATLGVGLSSYDATLEAAKIQSNAAIEAARDQSISAIEAAKIQSATSLIAYVENMNNILISKKDNVPNPTTEKEIETLLKSNSFQALRSLAGREKGTFVRFLAEKQLITTDQPEISLAGADLRGIDLEDAWLPDVNLRKAYILGSNLINANLTRANLIEVDFQGADLTGSVLTGADFTGADLTNARIDIKEAVRQGANFCNATMPDGRKGDCL